MREAGAHALHDRLLGGEAHRQKAHRARGALELRALLRHEQMRDETLAVLLEHPLDAIDLEHVDPDAEDHRAARISAFMSRTAFASPSNTARAMIE